MTDGQHRWWIASPGGTPQGPFTAEQIRDQARTGRLPADAQACLEGAEAWRDVRSIPEISGPGGGSPAASPPAYGGPMPGAASMGAHLPKVSYLWPILATIFCCLIGGIISIVYTAKANEAAVAGDPMAYESAKGTAKTWLIVSVVTAFVIFGLQIALMIAGAGMGMATSP